MADFLANFAVMKPEEFVREVCGALPEGRLLVCVSGGADSMALLHACVLGGRDCVAVHCDFHLRGAESERDREFVESECARLGVALRVEHFDVEAYRLAHGVSLEMACRELRYAAFGRIAGEEGCVRVVVAHNSDDNDETMLLNLLRGTGVAGLCGMSGDTGVVARPMLGVSRGQVEEFMRETGNGFVTDSSNLTSDFRRNFIRRELLPLIATRWPGVRKSLARTRRNLTECRRVCDSAMEPWAVAAAGDLLPAEVYEGAPSRSLLLAGWLRGRGASATQIDEMACGLRPGRRWRLSGCEAVMSREGVRLRFPGPDGECGGWRSGERLELTREVMELVRTNRGESVLYYRGGGELRFRRPRRGDRIAPMGMTGTKLVSDVLREAGVDVCGRQACLLCVDASDRVIWIPGVRRSRHLAVRFGRDRHVYRLEAAGASDNKSGGGEL